MFPTRLLTSEDEYKWYWHQMIYFPETINTISTRNSISPTRWLVFPWLCTLLTLCMLASWSHEGAVFLDFLSSYHSVTSSLFPYLGSTNAPCSRLEDPVPPSPKWRPHSQGPRTLPCRDPEQVILIVFLHVRRVFLLFSWIFMRFRGFIDFSIQLLTCRKLCVFVFIQAIRYVLFFFYNLQLVVCFLLSDMRELPVIKIFCSVISAVFTWHVQCDKFLDLFFLTFYRIWVLIYLYVCMLPIFWKLRTSFLTCTRT